MPTLLKLGNHIINADQITQAKWLPAEPEHEKHEGYTMDALPARVEVHLVALTSVEHEASSPGSIIFSGDLAHQLWGWLERHASNFEVEKGA